MRDLRYSALGALLITAVRCGGSETPPGGGNGDTDGGGTTDGTTGNGGRTDGHVPNPSNPLIRTIQGIWELIAIDYRNDDQGWIDLMPDDARRVSESGTLVVDAGEPQCKKYGAAQPPGDACVRWTNLGPFPPHFVLEGDAIRVSISGVWRADGQVLDNGRRIEYYAEQYINNINCPDWDEEAQVCRGTQLTRRYRKLD